MSGEAPKRRRIAASMIAGALIFATTGGCGVLSGLDGYSACGDDCADAMPGPPALPPETTDGSSPDAGSDDVTDAGGEVEAASMVGPVDAEPPGSDAVAPESGDASPPPRDAPPEGSRPDASGCQCEASSCCSGGACQTAHANGVGQTFYDCVAQGTFTQTQAMEACVAFTGKSTECVAAPTGVCGTSRAICSNGASTCWCWTYAGTAAGTVEKQMGLCPSSCPNANGTMWN